MRVYQTIRGWISGWDVPETASGLEFPEVAAASVVLRLDGEVIGEATEASGDEIERAGTVYRAVRNAYEQADRRLPIDRDALFDERIGEVATRILLEIELSGEPVPLASDEFAAVGIDISTGLSGPAVNPGIEGIGVRFDDRLVVRMPGAMIRRNMGPGAATVSALVELTDDPRAAKTTLEDFMKRGYTFYRFETTHLAQPRAGIPPLFLHRGGRVVEASEVSSVAKIKDLADGLARNLRGRAWPGIEKYGLLGTYDPVRGRYKETTATPLDQAIVVAALLAHERSGAKGAVESGVLARNVLADLAVVENGEPEPWKNRVTAAACVWAITRMDAAEVDAQSDVSGLLANCIETLKTPEPEGEGTEEVQQGTDGLVALGLVCAAGRDASLLEQANRAVRETFMDTPGGQLVSQMPYLLYAERELSGLTGQPIPSGAALTEMRRLVLEHQIGPSDIEPADRDLVGGIVFTVGKTALPTSQSLRPIAALGAMLGDASLTPAGPGENGRMTNLVSLTTSLRFVMQLAASDANGYMYAKPERAEWGVRRAIWNQDMPIEATALALLATCDVLEAVEGW